MRESYLSHAGFHTQSEVPSSHHREKNLVTSSSLSPSVSTKLTIIQAHAHIFLAIHSPYCTCCSLTSITITYVNTYIAAYIHTSPSPPPSSPVIAAHWVPYPKLHEEDVLNIRKVIDRIPPAHLESPVNHEEFVNIGQVHESLLNYSFSQGFSLLSQRVENTEVCLGKPLPAITMERTRKTGGSLIHTLLKTKKAT